MDDHRYFLVHSDTNTAFELGIGDWKFVFRNGIENIDRNNLLRDLIVFSSIENLFVQPSYILWLRDSIWDFATSDNTNLAQYDFSDKDPDGIEITKSRFDASGSKILDHVIELYK